MGQYTSYYLYQKFEKRDGQDFIPVYPNTYSVDADGTMPKVVKEQNDVNCGYVPPSDPIYQWVQLTPSSDPDSYWCDNCPAEPIYQWTVMMPTSDPSSYWCDECTVIYRWVDSGTTCVDYDLYQNSIKQVSYNNGATWENVSPEEYSATTLIEADSPSCGYVPPKLIATYIDSTTYRVGCDSSTTLSQSEVRGHSTSYSAMTSAEIGDCVTTIGASAFTKCYYLASVDIPSGVTSIGEHAFRSCGSLTSVTIPNSVTSIGDSAFDNCSSIISVNIPDSVTSIGEQCFFGSSGLTNVTIGSGVTSIGESAFDCRNITSVTINAVTPPTIGNYAFYNTNNYPIYVPCRSVDVYKSTSGWTTYASRIQGIAPCSPIYRWTDSGTTCVGYDKYQNSIKQVSYDSGTTWENAVPTQYSATTLIEAYSSDCGCVGPSYRWQKASTSDYECYNANKYYKEYYQVSCDNGVTWENVAPEQTRRSDDLIEADSYACGYRERTSSGTPYCVNFDKYETVYNEVSRDYGETWVTTTTEVLIEEDAGDCIPYNSNYFTIEVLQDGSFGLSGDTSAGVYYYSKDSGQTWTSKSAGYYVSGTTGEEILFKSNRSIFGTQGVGKFVGTGNFNAKGNLFSLTHGDNFTGSINTVGNEFYGLFSGNTHLISAENLAFTSDFLGAACYSHMFDGCSSLTTAPILLPATTLGTRCYSYMFNNCSSLTTAPVLHQDIGPAGECFRHMFCKCTSLVNAPEISVPIATSGMCYAMFSGCTALETAPSILLGANNDSYMYMFAGCTSLTTAPELSATTLKNNCYMWMFSGCTSLNYIKCLATSITATNCLYGWVNGVSSSGTFVKNSSMNSWPSGISGIPSGWTIEDAT